MKKEIEGRPALVAAIGLCMGVTVWQYPLNGALGLALFLWLSGPRPRRLLMICFLLGCVLPKIQSHPPLAKGWQVLNVRQRTRWTENRFGASMLGETGGNLVSVYVKQGAVMTSGPGELLEVRGVVKPENSHKPGTSLAQVSATKVTSLAPPGLWEGWATRWRDDFLRFNTRFAPPEDVARLQAVCFGDTDGFGSDELQLARESGTLQPLLASGLQVMGLAFLVETLLQLIGVPRAFMILVLGFALGTFGLVVQLKSNVIRNVMTVLLGRSAYLVRRSPDSLSAACLIGSCSVLLDWQSVFRPGFILGMTALLSYHLTSSSPLPSASWQEAVAQGSALLLRRSAWCFVFLLPVQALLFHHVSLTSALLMPVVIGFVPLLVALAILAHGISIMYLPLAVGCQTALVLPLERWLFAGLNALESISWGVDVPAFSAYLLLPYWLLAVYLWRQFARA